MVYDYIIIGSGVAGLNFARYLPENKKVLIVCKKSPWQCNTFYAQGGVACAVDEEDIPLHIKDTLKAGAYYNNVKAVERLSKYSIEVINVKLMFSLFLVRTSTINVIKTDKEIETNEHL